MNMQETVVLIAKVQQCVPQQMFAEYSAEVWSEALEDVRVADAMDALKLLMQTPLERGQSLYVMPGHIIKVVGEIRQRRRQSVGTGYQALIAPDDLYGPVLRTIAGRISDGVITDEDMITPEYVEQVRATVTKELVA